MLRASRLGHPQPSSLAGLWGPRWGGVGAGVDHSPCPVSRTFPLVIPQTPLLVELGTPPSLPCWRHDGQVLSRVPSRLPQHTAVLTRLGLQQVPERMGTRRAEGLGVGTHGVGHGEQG